MKTVASVQEQTGPVQPRWSKVEGAVRYSGICRSKIYELIRRGAIRSACLREEANSRGTRLIHLRSLDDYIMRHTGVWSIAPDKVTADIRPPDGEGEHAEHAPDAP
jgi:hypothetical protein